MSEENEPIVRRHYASPEDAYWAFFSTYTAKNSVGRARAMRYPHVRVSARGTAMYRETREAYASGESYEGVMATGWVRSQGIVPTRLHESADKVHLAGGWTRYNAADEPILSNRVTYIITRLDGSWGIQGRFGLDTFSLAGVNSLGNPGQEGKNAEGSAAAATDVVERHLQALDARDFAGCARLNSYPVTKVGVGEVQQFEDEAALERWLAAMPQRRASTRDVRAAQTGTDGVNVAVTTAFESGQAEHALFLVGKIEGLWRIVAHSIIAS